MKNDNGLNSEEIKKAKENGFILTGESGVGKTTLLNVIFEKKSLECPKAICSSSELYKGYYYKNKNGKCFYLIDTPDLYFSSKDPEFEKEHLENIRKIVKEQNIHIKGILFLTNFQKESLNAGEQRELINLNNLFPIQRFWKNIILIYTKCFTDPDGDELDDIIKEKNDSNKIIFKKIIDKIKNVSEPVEYEKLNIQYFNCFWPLIEGKRNYKHHLNCNNDAKNKLDNELSKLSETDPLFSKIEYAHIYNYPINEHGKYYLAEIEFIDFYDLNDKPLRRINFEVKNKTEIKKKI